MNGPESMKGTYSMAMAMSCRCCVPGSMNRCIGCSLSNQFGDGELDIQVNGNRNNAPYGSCHQERIYSFIRNRRHIHSQGKNDSPSIQSAPEFTSQTEEAEKAF